MTKVKLPFAAHILLMDVLGSALFAAGIYGLVVKAEVPGMAFLEVVDGAWHYLVCGILMWIPMVTQVVRLARRAGKQ